MTRAASDCTSEHGKNYLDSRLMSDMAIYRQLALKNRIAVRRPCCSARGENEKCNLRNHGCRDHTKTIADEELHDHYTQLMRDVDLQVFGRKTYQLMVPYWPDIAKSQSETKAENEFARAFDSINKIVFSRSLDSAEKKTRELFVETFTTKYLTE